MQYLNEETAKDSELRGYLNYASIEDDFNKFLSNHKKIKSLVEIFPEPNIGINFYLDSDLDAIVEKFGNVNEKAFYSKLNSSSIHEKKFLLIYFIVRSWWIIFLLILKN